MRGEHIGGVVRREGGAERGKKVVKVEVRSRREKDRRSIYSGWWI